MTPGELQQALYLAADLVAERNALILTLGLFVLGLLSVVDTVVREIAE